MRSFLGTIRMVLCVFAFWMGLTSYCSADEKGPRTAPAAGSVTKPKRHIPDMIILKFKADTSNRKMRRVLIGIGEVKSQKYMDRVFVVKVKKGLAIKDVLKRLLTDSDVEWAEQNTSGHAIKSKKVQF